MKKEKSKISCQSPFKSQPIDTFVLIRLREPGYFLYNAFLPKLAHIGGSIDS
jgi:hypothetical protein